ncbi:MAG TPA: OmpH family outer membrane protein [Gemmatales bacterium]|nr:OmpH family outer membrane protein [Gemmatales bacterium]
MIRKFALACGLAAFSIGLVPTLATAQTPGAQASAPVTPVRVGFVNMQEVLKLYPRYKALQDELKKKDDEFMGLVRKKQERMEVLQKEYAASADQKRKDAIETEVRSIKLEIDTIASDAKKTLGKYFDEEVAKIYVEFYTAVAEVSKSNGFDIVWRYTEDWNKDTYSKPEAIVRRMASNPVFPMYYDRERYDITYRVVSLLSQKYPAPTAPATGVQQTGGTATPATGTPNTPNK